MPSLAASARELSRHPGLKKKKEEDGREKIDAPPRNAPFAYKWKASWNRLRHSFLFLELLEWMRRLVREMLKRRFECARRRRHSDGQFGKSSFASVCHDWVASYCAKAAEMERGIPQIG